VSYGQISLTTLQANLAEKFDSAAYWTAEESRLALNEGIRVFNMLSGFWRTTATLTALPFDHFLSLPGNLTYRTRVTVASKPLEPATLFDMDNGRPNWRSENTASGGTVPTALKTWTPAGITLIFLWPAVTVNTAVVVEGIVTAPVLVNGGDLIDMGQEDIGPLLNYALHVLTFKEGGLRFKGTMKYYVDFIEACAQKNGRIRMSNLYRWVQGLDLNRSARPVQMKDPPPSRRQQQTP
jgi:hypothetical protein